LTSDRQHSKPTNWYEVYFQNFELARRPHVPEESKGICPNPVPFLLEFFTQGRDEVDKVRGKAGPPTADEPIPDIRLSPTFLVCVALDQIRDDKEVPAFLRVIARGSRMEMETMPSAAPQFNKNIIARKKKLAEKRQQQYEYEWMIRYQTALIFGALPMEAVVYANSFDSHEEFKKNNPLDM